MKSKHVMTIFAGAMLVYTGWRTFDYMGGSLLDVDVAVRLIISVAFLAFSEIGLLIWLHSAQPSATTDLQETTATVMVWVDFFGSMIVGLADLAKHNTLYAIDLSVIDPLLFLAPWVLVVLNVGGYLVYHMNDSEAKLDREERRLAHAEHQLEMEARRAAIKELTNQKQAIAGKLSPHYYRDIHDRVVGRTVNRFEKETQPPSIQVEQPARLPAAKRLFFSPMTRRNKAAYNAEVEAQDADGHPNGSSLEG